MKHAQTQILDVRILHPPRGPELSIACPCFAASIGFSWQFVLLKEDGCLLLKIGPFRLIFDVGFRPLSHD